MLCIVLSWLQVLAKCYRDLGIKTEFACFGFQCAEEGRAHPMLSHDRKCVFCGGCLKALMFMKCLLRRYVLIYHVRLDVRRRYTGVHSSMKLLICVY